jgi:hypothetical protein
MKCSEIQEKLSAYIDGISSPEEKTIIDEHIKVCKECNETLSDLIKAREYLLNFEEIETPSWLTQKVMTKVKAESEKRTGIFQKLFYPLHIKLPIEAIATLLIAIAAIYIFKTTQTEMKVQTMGEVKKAPAQGIVTEKKEKTSQPPVHLQKRVKEEFKVAPSPYKYEKKKELEVEKVIPPEERAVGGKDKEMLLNENKASDELRAKALSRPSKAQLQNIKKQSITLSLYVEHIDNKFEFIENIITQLGGKVLKTESFENTYIIDAELDSQKFNEFINKLKLIGTLKEKEPVLENLQGNVEIKTKISEK